MAASATSGDGPEPTDGTNDDDLGRRLTELERRAASIEALLCELLRAVGR